MDLSSQFAAFLERERVQAASVASLSSTVEGLSTKVTDLTTTVGRLSADNTAQAASIAYLLSESADLKRVVADVSRLGVPGGHWIWESAPTASGRAGRWVWSLEKFQPPPSAVVRFGAPASLLTLPVELQREIVELLPKSDQAQLCSVCMRLLEIASAHLRKEMLIFPPGRALAFLNNRLECPGSKSARITALLIPSKLFLDMFDEDLTESNEAAQKQLEAHPQGGVKVDIVFLNADDFRRKGIWTSLLSRLDPRALCICDLTRGRRVLPTIQRLPGSEVEGFTSAWTRLRIVESQGPGSLLLLTGDGYQLALSTCLRRVSMAGGGTGRVIVSLRQEVAGQVTSVVNGSERDVVRLLDQHAGSLDEAATYVLRVSVEPHSG